MGRKSKVTDEQLSKAVSESSTVSEVLRKVGIKVAGGSASHYSRRIERLGLDTTHFTGRGSTKGRVSTTRKTKEEILVKRQSGNRAKHHHLKRAMIESGVESKCSICGQLPEWMGNPLTLDVDHINEDWLDDRLENLRFLCPNCHSQFSRKLMRG